MRYAGLILSAILGFAFFNHNLKPFRAEKLENPTVHNIAGKVYGVTGLYHSAEEGFTVNAGIIFTPESLVFIDSGMTISSAEFLWNAAQNLGEQFKNIYLIITHRHSDHVFGMRIFKEKGAAIIAHKFIAAWFEKMNGRQYKNFLAKAQGWSQEDGDRIFGDVIFFPPDKAIEEDTILNIDGQEFHLLVTPGHTPDSISIYHPQSKSLFAGDTIYEGSPLTTRFGGPSEWETWISQLERLRELDIDVIVPGHGKICPKQEIDRNISFLREVLSKKKI